jgi:hypothetical protein
MKHRLQPADKSFIKRLKAYYGIDSVSGWYEANQAKFLKIEKKTRSKAAPIDIADRGFRSTDMSSLNQYVRFGFSIHLCHKFVRGGNIPFNIGPSKS